MHLYCMDLTDGTFVGENYETGVAISVFDANGEEHGRSEHGFKWALDIEGALDMTTVMSMKDVNQQFGMLHSCRSQLQVFLADKYRQRQHRGIKREGDCRDVRSCNPRHHRRPHHESLELV